MLADCSSIRVGVDGAASLEVDGAPAWLASWRTSGIVLRTGAAMVDDIELELIRN